MTRDPTTMRWFDRVAAGLAANNVSNAEVGRQLKLTGQSVGQKLSGKRGVSVDELKALARLAGLSVSEAVGDDIVVIELQDEIDLIELYRLLSPEQRKMLLGLASQLAGQRPPG